MVRGSHSVNVSGDMMAGQAGWYNAPGEAGLLRYWNGSAWTEHRQPVPDAVPDAVESAPVAEAVVESSVEPAFEPAAAVVEPEPEPDPEPDPEPEPEPEPAAEAPHDPSPAPTPIADSITPSVPSAPTAAGNDWAPPDLATEPDWSMDQFEKQFEKPSPVEPNEPALTYESNFTQGFDSPSPVPAGPDSTRFDSPSLDSRNFDAPSVFASIFATPLASPGVSPELAAAPAPTAVQTSTAIPMPAAAVVEPTLLEPAVHEPDLVTVTDPTAPPVPSVDPAASVSRFAPEAPLSAALRYAPPPAAEAVIPSAEDRATFAAAKASVPEPDAAPNPKRKRLVRALGTMVLGFAIILIGAALVFFMGQQPVATSGQVQTLGIITSLGASNGECTPTARFAAGTGSYSATTGTAVSPCVFGLGQSVSVVYSPANPDASGRIVVPNLIQQYLWVVAVLGLAVVLISLLVFVFGAGSLAAGVAIVREGRPEKQGAGNSSSPRRRRRSEPADAGR